jgi:hypothetical protein
VTFLAVIVLVVIILSIMGRTSRPRITIIQNPVLAALNLIGPSAEPDIEDDLQQLTHYFSEIRQADDVSPSCDVLLLYCEIDSAGAVNGSSQSLRQIIQDAGATVVVVATNNKAENYIAATKKASFGQANLIMTLERDGSVLAGFLAQLFAQMKRGISMPVAWNNLAPQFPGAEHKDVPATICALERGQVVFR